MAKAASGSCSTVGAGEVISLSFSSNLSIIYAGSGIGKGPPSDGGAFLTRDGGAHWSDIDNGLSDRHVSAVLMDPYDSNIALAGTWFSGIFKTTDAGGHWSLTSPDPTGSLLLVGNVVFAGTNFGILESKDFGASWTLVAPLCASNEPSGCIYVGTLAASKDGQTLYAGADNGTILSSTNGGTSWTTKFRFSSIERTVGLSMAVNSGSATTVYAVTSANSTSPQTLWSSNDGGASWSLVPTAPPGVQAVATDPNNPGVIYVAGGNFCLKSIDGGNSFTNLGCSGDARALIVNPQNSDDILFASDSGISESNNRGLSWSSINGNLSNSMLTAGSVSSDGRVFVAAVQDYAPIVSLDGGASWGVSYYTDGEGGDALVNQLNSHYAYLYTGGGVFYTSTDGGSNFSRTSSITAVGGPPVIAGGECFPNLISLDPSNPSAVYVGTGNGIWKSTDYGVDFSSYALPGKGILAIVANGSTIYASTANAFLYSKDGGSTWGSSLTALGDVPTIAIDPRNSSIVFAGTSPYGRLYESVDGGRDFSEVTFPGLGYTYGLPCLQLGVTNISILGGQPVLFVGTAGGLLESPDLGKTWENLSYNMNGTTITSIEYVGGNLYVATYGQGFLEWPNFPTTTTSTTTTSVSTTTTTMSSTTTTEAASTTTTGLSSTTTSSNSGSSSTSSSSSSTTVSSSSTTVTTQSQDQVGEIAIGAGIAVAGIAIALAILLRRK